jgi:hypothetical protein
MEIGAIHILRSLPESAALRPGDRLTVKVLEVFEDQRALVSLGGVRTLAGIDFPVAAGDELRVQVQAVGGQVRLQMIPAEADPRLPAARSAGPVTAVAAEALKEVRLGIDRLADAMALRTGSLRLPAEARQVLDALRLFLEPFDPALDPAALASRFKEFCEGSGLFLEQRLAAAVARTVERSGPAPAAAAGAGAAVRRVLSTDLKARLAILADFFDSAAGRALIQESREAAGLARAASGWLESVRAGQAQMARSATAADPSPMVHFALPMPDGRGRVGLKIAYRRRPAAGKQGGHRAALLLELDRMGAVRTDLALLDARLDISVFVSSAALRDWVARHACEVRAALAPFFDHVAVQVSVSPRKIARFVSEDWRPGRDTLVDVRV